jgi:hypothetical protein
LKVTGERHPEAPRFYRRARDVFVKRPAQGDPSLRLKNGSVQDDASWGRVFVEP